MAKALAQRMRAETAKHARRARWQTVILLPLIGGIFAAYSHRRQLFGLDEEIRTACVVAMALLGWVLARALGRAVGPPLLRRLDPGRAGTVSFLVRLLTLAVMLLTALSIAGIDLSTLAVGGAMTAVIIGLAAQQTSVVLVAAIIPRREPSSVGLRAEPGPGARITDVPALLAQEVSTPTRATPHIDLEEVDADRVVIRIAATPRSEADGAQLADELLAAVAKATAAQAA